MRLAIMSAVILLTATAADAHTVLVEAEGFDEPGEWVVDQQFMDQMGSPMLLAHGMGAAVDDATTCVDFPAAGAYQVWVRTRDWAAPWHAGDAPGRFQVLVNGVALDTVFGTEGEAWHWQNGGTVDLPSGLVTLALHDLTGFEGRCDAILFSDEPGFMPPSGPEDLARFRRQALGLLESPEDVGPFDLVVVGGGLAGTCAAISGARLGLQVALIQDRPVLGGNNSSEVRVHLNGHINLPPYPALGNVVRELDSGMMGNAQPASNYADDKKLRVVRAEKNLHLFLNTHAFRVEKEGDRIAAVMGRDIRTNQILRFPGTVFADCTGDGTVGYVAGADYRMGREGRDETGEALAPETGDKMTLGSSVQWYSVETAAPSAFPDCPWALPFNEDTCQPVMAGEWDWETGMHRDQIGEFEFIRDHAFRAIYGNWAFLKNHSRNKAKYARRALGWVAYIAGKRESRRLLGDVVLRQRDIETQRPFPDACVTTTWSIDLHYPQPENAREFPGEEFRAICKQVEIEPYAIPYRCLYSRNVPNLMMAGRNISVTHVALGTVRVMRTGGMMGEVVGMAASLCKAHGTTPRGVYEEYLDELKALMQEGVGKPGTVPGLEAPDWLENAGANLARRAAVTVSGSLDPEKYPLGNINDGRIDIHDNGLRWVSDRKRPHVVELAWEKPQTVNAARVVSGYARGQGRVTDPIQDFVFECRDGEGWKEVPGTRTAGNTKLDWSATFPAVTTSALRLTITGPEKEISRVWEIALYQLDYGKSAAATFAVDADYAGGNIVVKGIERDTVMLAQDLRDTEGWWFYWDFRVRGAAGKTLTFQFPEKSPIGVGGPAISMDAGLHWQWLGTESVDGASFRYAFADDANEVRFAFAPSYLDADLERFWERHAGDPHLAVETLTVTRKGRPVERMRAGRLDGEPQHRVLITARHHACESMASYALEGILDAVLAETEDGHWYREHVEILAVPFMDKDGVEDGDQGKNRKPHDHNRDYGAESLYPSVSALRSFVPAWSGGRLRLALDLHCPYIRGGGDKPGSNERAYFVSGRDAAAWERIGAFSQILERVQEGPLVYAGRHNLPWGEGWNKNYSANFSQWAGSLPGILFATTMEIPYAEVDGVEVTAESARLLGRDLAKAIRRYLDGHAMTEG